MNNDFYVQLPVHSDFDDLAEDGAYTALPDGWFLGLADIVGSTQEVAAGRYKVINTVGAAVISAQINGAEQQLFPYVFGGDGATFAFWGGHEDKAREALAAVQRWALSEFNISVRASIVPVSAVREAGLDLKVARYQASPGATYAMFSGGGAAWADRQMKAGQYAVQPAEEGVFPNLEGLSCRWTAMKSRNGEILSVVIVPGDANKRSLYQKTLHDVVRVVEKIERSGHPVPDTGPAVSWPPEGLALEAHASHGAGSLFKRKIVLLFETLLAWLFFKTGLKAGDFDPVHYAQTVSRNADFRKFDDGLKMTIDCDPQARRKLQSLLDEAAAQGALTYGMFEQGSAIMTCIVPSITEDNHMHFIDGADGGYTRAAQSIKELSATKH